ncbi:glycosyltransferase [Pseudomonas sp. SH1-B]
MSGVIFDSEGLDALLQNTARSMLAFFGADTAMTERPVRERPLRLYLATELYVSGGHSRMLEDFIEAMPAFDHVIILSDLFGRNGGAAEVISQLESRGASVIVIGDGSLVARTLRIMHFLKKLQPDSCILFNHHQDAPIVAACLPEFCEHYFFYHHADHNLCLGARVSHLRHLDLSPWQFSRCASWKADNIYVPLTCPDRGGLAGKARGETPLVTCTAGSWIKFSEPYHIEFCAFIADVLAATGGRHIHIGNLPESVINDVRTVMVARGLDVDAFEHIGWVHSLWLSAQQLGVDLYLSSFPLGGGRGLVEMLGAGVPIAFHANPAAPYVCGETLRYPGAICWSYTDQLLSSLKGVDGAALERQSADARKHYESYFSWSSFSNCIATLGAARNQDLMPVSSVPYQDGARHYFDMIQRIESQEQSKFFLEPKRPRAPESEAVLRDFPLTTWLEARVVSPIQQQMINSHLASREMLPRVGVFVLDPLSAADSLAVTLGSISTRFPLDIEVVLVSSGEAGACYDNVVVLSGVAASQHAEVLNQKIEQSDYDWFMLVLAGEVFTPNGLLMLLLATVEDSTCRAVFADELLRMPDRTLGAAFRPAFNLDYFLAFPAAMSRHWLIRRDAFVQVGGFDPAFPDALEFDLLLRIVEGGGLAGLGHVDEPLLLIDAPVLADVAQERRALESHLERRGYTAARVVPYLPGIYRISYGHRDQPLVSIIISTKDQLLILQRCVESVLEKTSYTNYEVLIVDNNSETLEARAWLDEVDAMGDAKVRILRYPHPFNYSAINNMAARVAGGEYLVLLNNDAAIISENWLDELLNHAQRPEVGVVGAKLLYPDGRIQHAGVVLGLRGPADCPFVGEAMDAPGYMQRLQVDQNYSAVSAACLMIRKSLYTEVGGLDEETFKVSYNDVDLCLKAREAGYLTVWTPHAVVMHEGSVSQTKADSAARDAKRKRFVAEQDAMYAKWLSLIAADPAYNRNLSLNGAGFALEADSQLTWRPLDSWRPLPVVLAHPADPWGCGNYRVIKPFEALRDAGLVDGMLSEGLLQVADLARYDPDVLVLQRQLGDERLEAMRRIKMLSRAFKVYELDDYLPNLPMKSLHREHMPRDVLKSLRKGLGFVDRFVVSTEALAEAFSGLHADIRVIENRLPREWWQGLTSQRRRGRKPRVGWAGGVSHTGDLELIADVIKEMAGEVEWVFMGMCPNRIRPYVQEVHTGVDINAYPAALANLDLDLALAPVEQNLFNECKSNLRLLEYGACGFPVVCSDLRCYDGELPVTRVKNRFKDWVDAIRMHVNDLDASARQGDALKAAVMRDWMLEGGGLELWRRAWLPD